MEKMATAKVTATILSVVVAFCISGVFTHQEAFAVSDSSSSAISLTTQEDAMDEAEPNDDYKQATTLPMNRTVYGECDSDSNSFGISDPDYYKVTLPQSGSILITFVNDMYVNDYDFVYVDVYNRYYEEVGNFIFSIDTTRPMSNTISLSKGDNWLHVYSWKNQEEHHPYHFKLSYKIPSTTVTKVTGAKKAFTARWTKKSGAAKYQMRYSAKKSMSSAKTIGISKRASLKKVTNLKSKKTYWVQVRVAKSIAGQTYWSSWSSKKAVKTK